MNEMATADAKAYLEHLSGLMLGARVTDRAGELIQLEEGISRAEGLISGVGTEAKVLLVGNGGSAAIGAHIQNDLCKAVGVQALVFNETALLTALTNDDGYEDAFATLIRLWGRKGDVLIAISSSGQSENILRASRAARKAGLGIITLSGFKEDNPLSSLGDVNFYVESSFYGHVEVSHMALCHLMTDRAMARARSSPDRGERGK